MIETSKVPTGKKTGGIKKYTNKDGIRIEVGTINKFDCKAVYVSWGCWVTTGIPLYKLIEAFRRRIRGNGYSYTNDKFKGLISNHFTSVDHTESKNHKAETTYITFETTLFGDFNWYDSSFQELLKQYALSYIELIIAVEEDFILTGYKK